MIRLSHLSAQMNPVLHRHRLSTHLLLAGVAVISVAKADGQGPAQPPPGMVKITGGAYAPLYSKLAGPRQVADFLLDECQVTNRDFLTFVTDHPEWRRSRIGRNLADTKYLSHWRGDLDPGGDEVLDAPVTNVSWFAAKAYCAALGKRLPTQDEWEFVALADAARPDASKDPKFIGKLLEWYSKPTRGDLPSAATAESNYYGVRGLHGVVWEWVGDFNSTMVVGDSRGDNSIERKLFCGGASLLASDVGNYAAFMRYAFRSSLQGTYCVNSLGFRASISSADNGLAAPAGNFTTIYGLPGTWQNQNGDTLVLARLGGKPRVISMGFTRCEYACPRIFADMQRIENALGTDAEKVGFTFFSIDPKHDTPAAMEKKMAELKMNSERWTFLTAPDGTVRDLAVALEFKFQEVQEFFAHSNLIAVVDAGGNVVHREESLGADIVPTVTALRNLLKP